MRRREFIRLIGGAAAAWPALARAQQSLPVVGMLSAQFADGFAPMAAGFRGGLGEAGFVERRDVRIEDRWADGRYDQLSTLASDLVDRKAAAIFANGPPAVRAVMAATSTIPIVFSMGEDPVKEGIVKSLNRPEGNVTGFTYFTNQLFGKRLSLLAEIFPRALRLAFLVNPNNPNAELDTNEARAAASVLGRPLEVLKAKTEGNLTAAFDILAQQHIQALVVGVDGFFVERRKQIVALAERHAVPTIYDRREYALAGGLISYGASQVDSWRQGGVYVGRILNGAKPAELPVQQAAKFEFVVNLKTAKALGLELPPMVVARADEVIE